MADETQGKKFPLLIYRRWAKMLRLPSLLIAVVGGVAWWYAPSIPILVGRDWVALLVGTIGALIFLYSLYARQVAYAQCRPNYLRVRTPFMSLAISYGRLLQVRPTEFHSQLNLAKMNRSQRRLLKPFLGRTVILLEMRSFPVSERRLRLWLPWFMFASEVTGLVLVVEDWMGLSQQIGSFSDRWVTRRQARQRPKTGFMR